MFNSMGTAELLRISKALNGNSYSWHAVAPMLKPKIFPSAVYFKSHVFVLNLSNTNPELEMLTLQVDSLLVDSFGQWTRILCSHQVDDHIINSSITVFDGRLLVAGI